jgi:hypothetical protein
MFAVIPTDARGPRIGYCTDVRILAFSVQLLRPFRWSRIAFIDIDALRRSMEVESPAADNVTGVEKFQPGKAGRHVSRSDRRLKLRE